MDQITGLVVNYGISNTIVLEMPQFTIKPVRYWKMTLIWKYHTTFLAQIEN